MDRKEYFVGQFRDFMFEVDEDKEKDEDTE